MFFSSRKRITRAQPKTTQRSSAVSSFLPNSARTALLVCFVALCVAGAYKFHDGLWSSIMAPSDGDIVDSDPKELDIAIDKSLGKDRKELGPASRAMKASFEAHSKHAKTGQVNARVAGHLLQNYFAADGWRVQGLTYQAMRPTSVRGLHDALQNVAVLKSLAPGVHAALKHRAAARGGFTLKQITGLAAVIKGKLLNEGHVTTVLRMLYRRQNVSFESKIQQDVLENVTDAYLSHLNVVDTYADSVAPAFQNWTAMQELKSKALEHAYALATRSAGKLGVGANLTSVNYSSQVLSVMAENMTRAFERRYITDHCENMGRLLSQSSPKGTGRLRMSTFYSQVWNGTMNFAEPKRHLRLSGALDESDNEADSTRVLAANYLQGHLNCIRHSQYYSLCCPNQCVSIMQSIEAAIKTPVATTEEILDVVANISSPTVEAPREIPPTLATRLHDIPERHGGVVPLHGRLFAQWLHFAFPNECRYPQEKDAEMRKVRLTAKEVTTPEKEETAWASVNRGFDVPATRLHTVPWSEKEVLPLREEQVWTSSSVQWRDLLRAAVCVLVVLAMARTIYKLTCSSQIDEDAKVASDQLCKNEAFENRVKKRVELMRFEYNVELTPGKGQEQMKVGMEMQPTSDPKDGLVVEDILSGGLLHARNETIVGTKRIKVLVGDRLIAVNEKTLPKEMMDELSMLSGKTSLRFSRESSRAAPLIWTADLERSSDEHWGMALSEVAESQNSKELTLSRVVAGGPVDKWNRRATKKNKPCIHPGDIIIACNPEVDCKKILARLQNDTSLHLTVLRWQAATEAKVPAKCSDKSDATNSKASQNEAGVVQNVDQVQDEVVEEVTAARDEPKAEIEEHRCACCDAAITDKFVVLCCSAGEVKYYRRTCWRQKFGGFTLKHIPRRCTCGSPLSKVEVFERSSPNAEPRLIHTILDGPMEVDVRMDEAPDQEDRPGGGGAQRRGASAMRRAAEGDARRRAASTGRRRSPERNVEHEEGADVDEPFFRPRRQREPNPVIAEVSTGNDQATRDSEQPLSSVDKKTQLNTTQPSQATKAEAPKTVDSKRVAEVAEKKMQSESEKKMQSESLSKRAHNSSSLEQKASGNASNVPNSKAGETELKKQADRSNTEETKREVDPWFVGADPWEVGKLRNSGNDDNVETATTRHSSNAHHSRTDKNCDPWFASQDADPWSAARNQTSCGGKTERTKMTDSTVAKHGSKYDDPWFSAGTDPWETGRQKTDKKDDPWFACRDADPWSLPKHASQDSEKTQGHNKQGSDRSSSRGLKCSSIAAFNPMAEAFVPGGRSLPSLDLLARPPTPPPPLEPQAPQVIDVLEPPPGLLEPLVRPVAVLGSASEAMQCPPPPGLPEPLPPPGLPEPAKIGLLEPTLLDACDAPPGLPEPALATCDSVREVVAPPPPPGLSLVAPPPGLESEGPQMLDGGSALPIGGAPAGLSAPPGLPEPDDQGMERNETTEVGASDSAKANKTNRWSKNRHGASE